MAASLAKFPQKSEIRVRRVLVASKLSEGRRRVLNQSGTVDKLHAFIVTTAVLSQRSVIVTAISEMSSCGPVVAAQFSTVCNN